MLLLHNSVAHCMRRCQMSKFEFQVCFSYDLFLICVCRLTTLLG